MSIFARMAEGGHEQLLFCFHRNSGLKAMIAIHDTTLGPALGGCRMWPYESEAAALADVLRLSQGMTYKAAVAGVNHGGGKAVIWGDASTQKSEELFRALGRFVQGLRGRFITGTDVGTTQNDFVWSRQETPYLVALPEEYGGSGDSAIITAYGVYRGIQAAALEIWGDDSLKGRRVAVQGVGKVGYHLVRHLVDAGARVVVSDVNPDNLQRVAADFPAVQSTDPRFVFDAQCDVFAPCALGGILNDDTCSRLQCRVVAGSANNQLQEPRHGDLLHQRGILYCPDFVINAGGLIQVADELRGYNRERAFRHADGIYRLLREIFAISRSEGIAPDRAAAILASRRLANIAALAGIYAPE